MDRNITILLGVSDDNCVTNNSPFLACIETFSLIRVQIAFIRAVQTEFHSLTTCPVAAVDAQFR